VRLKRGGNLHHKRPELQGCGCPVGVAVSQRPEVCEVIVALISKLTLANVRSCCRRDGRPSCCFEIGRISEPEGGG
jgi:hypothetical protein